MTTGVTALSCPNMYHTKVVPDTRKLLFTHNDKDYFVKVNMLLFLHVPKTKLCCLSPIFF